MDVRINDDRFLKWDTQQLVIFLHYMITAKVLQENTPLLKGTQDQGVVYASVTIGCTNGWM